MSAPDTSLTPPPPIPGLYVAGRQTAEALQALGVSHVLDVPGTLSSKLAAEARVRIMGLGVFDEPEANLLDQLPAALDFIASALGAGGRVLVACEAGVSRSVAVALAHLMREEGGEEPVEARLAELQQVHPAAEPNEGFMAQLELFRAMGCRLDRGHAPYRKFRTENLGRQYHVEGRVALSELDEGGSPGEGSISSGAPGNVELYRCKRCRALVGTSQNSVPHDKGEGDRAFTWRKRKGKKGEGLDVCQSLFVEPLSWMKALEDGDVQGKISCSCGSRLGNFNWAGLQCNCGRWVTPAFQLQISQIDVEDSGSLRLPLRGGEAPVEEPTASSTEVLPPRGARARPVPSLGAAPALRGFSEGACLIFDCDGVLVDSERMSCAALHDAVRKVTGASFPHRFPEDFLTLFGSDVKGSLEKLVELGHLPEPAGLDEDAREALAARVAAAKERYFARRLKRSGLEAFDGVKAIVGQAKRLGVRVGIGSSGTHEKIATSLELSGLSDLFRSFPVVGSEDVARGKPEPDVYLRAFELLEAGPGCRKVIIEDSILGLRAARAAGAFAIGVTNTFPHEALLPEADLVVESLRDIDLRTVLQNLAPQS